MSNRLLINQILILKKVHPTFYGLDIYSVTLSSWKGESHYLMLKPELCFLTIQLLYQTEISSPSHILYLLSAFKMNLKLHTLRHT